MNRLLLVTIGLATLGGCGGTSLVYTSPSTGIVRMLDDGTAVTVVHGTGTSPTFGPGATSIAFIEGYDIQILDAGGAVRNLTNNCNYIGRNDETCSHTQVRWSPDGTHLAYIGDRIFPGGSYAYRRLQTVNANGGDNQVLHPSSLMEKHI